MRRFGVLNFFFLYAIAIGVLPILAIPGALVGTDLQKGIIAAGVLGVLCGSVGVSLALFRQTISIPRSFLPLACLSLIGSVSVSALFATSWRMSVWGEGIEVGTVASLVLFTVAVFAGLLVSPRGMVVILRVFVGATTLAAVISAILHIWMPGALGGATLVGAWEQLSFLIGAATLVALTFLYRETGRSLRVWNGGVALVLTACFFLYFIPTVSALLALSLGLVTVGSYAVSWRVSGIASPRIVLAGALISLAFLLCTFVVQRPILDLPSSVRPSALASELVVVPVFLDNLRQTFFGAAPNTFPAIWEKYRPAEFNMTPYWNITPDSGFSTLFTFAATLGIFGVLMYLWCFAVPFIDMGMRVFRSGLSAYALVPGSFTASLALVLYALGSFFLFPVSMPLFLLGGLAIGFLSRLSSGEDVVHLGISRKFLRYTAALGLLVIGASFVWVSVHQYSAAEKYARGVAIGNGGDLISALPLLEEAARLWPLSRYQRDASRVAIAVVLTRVQAQVEDSGAAGADVESLRDDVLHAIALSDLSVASDNNDSTAWIIRAALFVNIFPGFPDALREAQQAVNQASRYAPNRPEVAYTQALIHIKEGNMAAARAELAKALRLKSDYRDAQQLLPQIQ